MQYFYNDKWYSYEELHDLYGITNGKASLISLYDFDLNKYTGWEFEDQTWITQDNKWYNQDDLPYYKKTDNTLTVYLIDKPLLLNEYMLRNSKLYEYDNHLYSYAYIHDNYGITLTPSSIYYAKDNIIRCWYNEDLNIYWDTDTNKWLSAPPQYDDTIIDVSDINSIGACGLFMYYNKYGSKMSYGDVVNGSDLKPICLKFPATGELSCIQMNTDTLTGTWRLLSAVPHTSKFEPCIVFAMKVSNNDINQNTSTTPNNAVTYIDYNF